MVGGTTGQVNATSPHISTGKTLADCW